MAALQTRILRVLNVEIDAEAWKHEEGLGSDEAHDRLRELSDVHMAKKVARFTPELMRAAERSIMLQFLDAGWKEHLLQLDRLRQGIGLRAVGQRDPLNEYKQEAFILFQSMLDTLKENVTTFLSWVEIGQPAVQSAQPRPQSAQPERTLHVGPISVFGDQEAQPVQDEASAIPAQKTTSPAAPAKKPRVKKPRQPRRKNK
jgi:preprotein translocase subunit SecA